MRQQKQVSINVAIGLLIVVLVLVAVIGYLLYTRQQPEAAIPVYTTDPLITPNLPTAVPTALPTSTPIPIVDFSGWATVQASTPVFDRPGRGGKVIETTGDKPGVVLWQSKTDDNLWYERAGGGWIQDKYVYHYSSQEEALAALGQQPAASNPAPAPTKSFVQILSEQGQLTFETDDCHIKGDVSFNTGEKIYHLPGQKYYDATKINPDYGERWFCTEEDAINNGWRKSKV